MGGVEDGELNGLLIIVIRVRKRVRYLKKIKGENELFILSEHYFLCANWSLGDVHSSKCSV